MGSRRFLRVLRRSAGATISIPSRRKKNRERREARQRLRTQIAMENLEHRHLLAALVGVDFDAGTNAPADWTTIGWPSTTISTPFTQSDLVGEDGNATTIDLTVSGAGGTIESSAAAVNGATIPAHSQSLAAIDGQIFTTNAGSTTPNPVTFTWSDLSAGTDYEIYVMGLEGNFSSIQQFVTITGAGAPISFTQDFSMGDLMVNRSVGSSSQPLSSYAEIVTADGSGEITIQVDPAGFTFDVSLGALAIREIAAPEVSVFIVEDSVSEAAGASAASGVVTRNTDTTNALTVNLTSDDTSEATVPATVTIPAGSSFATFNIGAVDDVVIDGTQTATITASAAGHADGSDTLDVLDDDAETLAVAIADDVILESGGSTTAVVTRSDTAGQLTVNLLSGEPGRATVPATVIIPDGSSTSAPFPISIIDNAIDDGTVTVLVSASGTGYVSGSDAFDVVDEDVTANLGLSIAAASVVESAGATATTGTVSRTLTNLIVNRVDRGISISDGLLGSQSSSNTSDGSYVARFEQENPSSALDSHEVDQNSTIDSTGIDAEGYVNIQTDSTSLNPISDSSVFDVHFDLTTTQDFVLTGFVSADSEEADASALIELSGPGLATPLVFSQVSNASTTGGVTNINQTGTLTPGTYRLRAMADGSSSGSNAIPDAEAEFSLDLQLAPAALTVTLASDDTSEATVPASVTIAANQTSATFDIAAVDDPVADGDQTVTITASSQGYSDATDTLIVVDDDASTLTLNIVAASISEGGGSTTATVTRNSDTTNPLTVNLSSNDTSEATVPATVTIAAGQATSAPFTISAVDDFIIDGTQNVTITASAASHSDGTDSLDVTDNDAAGFTITETDGYTLVFEDGTTDTYTVVLDSQPASDVVIDIANPDTGEVTVSDTSLTFTNANWDVPQIVTVTGVNDPDVDGDQQTVLTLSINDAASDDAFDGLPDQTVTVTTKDVDAGIEGTVWNDTDGDGTQDAGEPGLAGVTVYLDLNRNGQFDGGEPVQISAADGSYSFDNLPAGEYVVAQILPTGLAQTFPQVVGTPGTFAELINDQSSLSLYATHAPHDVERLFILEKVSGNIQILDLTTGQLNPTPFLTIPGVDSASEGGLLGLAFHPDYANNGKFYVYVTIDNGGVNIGGATSPFSTHIREYTVSANPDVADPNSMREILSFVQPQANHNAGWIDFSPVDGFLYISSGDGGGGNDDDPGHTPGTGNSQDITDNLLGKMLRIDVDGDDFPTDANKNYAIPSSNPFVGITGDDEIWSYGLRNHWRNSFDALTGDLWIGDVGQGAREEINFQPASSVGGENYGWRIREGFIDNPANDDPLPSNLTDPVYDYTRGTGELQGRSVVGGYVYRGQIDVFQDLYVFADTASSNIWTFNPTDPINTVQRINDDLVPDAGGFGPGFDIVSFGEDGSGNLYIVQLDGQIHKVSVNLPGTHTVLAPAGQTVSDIDFGNQDPGAGAIGDFVWEDLNANGVQDAGEPGIDGVTVNLIDSTSLTQVATTTTAGGGQYSFSGLAAGSYIVEFVTPTSYQFSLPDKGISDATDSDADPVTGRSGVITLAPSTNIDTVDAGMFRLATIGDRVWDDTNGDGVQQTGENGLAGVAVRLIGQVDDFQDGTVQNWIKHPSNPNLQPFLVSGGGPNGAGDDFMRANSSGGGGPLSRLAVRNQTQWQMDMSGMFSIEADVKNLGNTDLIMRIAIDGPGGWFASTNAAAQPIAAGTDWTRLVFSLNPADLTNQFESESAAEAGTDLAATLANVGELRIIHNDQPNFRGDSIAASIGLDNITAVVGSTTTSGNGIYSFTTRPGSYQAQFDLPAGRVFSPADQGGDDAADSDVDANGNSPTVTVISGETNNTIDAGTLIPTLTVNIAAAAIAEDGSTTATVTRNTDITVPLVVTLTSSDTGEATVPTTITIPAGQTTSPSFTISGVDDSLVDGTQTVTITGSAAAHADGSDTLDVTNINESNVSITASAPVTENGGDVLTFTLTRDQTSSESPALTVTFSTSGSATSGTDYNLSAAGTVTFPAGASTTTVTATPIGDTTVEPDETVTLLVIPGANYSVVVPRAATGTILDDDSSAVSVDVSASSVTENGTDVLTYTFTRDNTSSETPQLTVNFDTTGTATAGVDYSATATGTVTFAAGSATTTVTVDPTGDTTVEPDETVTLTVTSGSGYSVGAPASATAAILNDDKSEVSVAVSPASVAEDGTDVLVYTFTRDDVSSETPALSVSFDTTGTATAGTDFTATATGTVTFAAGADTATVTVTPVTDTTVEPDETVVLTIATSANYDLGSPASATGTITDDDISSVSVRVTPLSVAEDGTDLLTYIFTRDNVSSESPALTANFLTAGTATAGVDYVASDVGSVAFAPGASTAVVTVDPTTDDLVEFSETVIMSLTPGNYRIGAPASAQGTIVNDDKSTVSVSVTPSSVLENGSDNLVYTFTRSNTSGESPGLTLLFDTTGTATAGTDYVAGHTGFVNFAAGSDTATVNVNPTGDSTVEPDETVVLTIASSVGYDIGSPNSATGTITDDDESSVSVSVSAPSVDENGSDVLTYTFTRDNSSSESPALTVNFDTTGSATAGNDYTATASGSITIAAGADSATVTVTPTGDSIVEPDETVTLTVQTGSGYQVGTPSVATGTIANDDVSAVSVAVSPASVLENGTDVLTYTFTRDNTSGQTPSLTVDFLTSGTATDGTDYTASASGSVTFAAGSSTATVTVDPAGDPTVEPDETVILTVAAGTGYTVGSPDSATGTITNDDAISFISVTVDPDNVTEDGATDLVYTFRRDGDTTIPLTVNFDTTGSATSGSDYTASESGSISFAAGDSIATLTVNPTIDTIVEPDEDVTITLSPGTGYLIGAPSVATGTITNDDQSSVSVAVAPSSVSEDGTGQLVYTFTRDSTSSETPALTVNVSTSGSATSGSDYAAPASTVTFAAGANTATLSIDPTDDSFVEPDESLIVTVDAGAGYNVGAPSSAQGTIDNDDVSSVSVAVAPTAVDEDGTGALVYTFTRDNTSGETPALTVNIATSGTATAGTDYTAPANTVTFAAGADTATVTIDPTDDAIVEPDESLTLSVIAGAGYNVGAPADATGTILNDDQSSVSVNVQPPSVAEDGTGSLIYTFTRDNTSSETPALTVNYADSGSATSGSDYSALSGSVSFAAGSATAVVTVDPTDDAIVEPDESLTLTVSAGAGYSVGGNPSASGTIENDDTSSVSVSVSPNAVPEDGSNQLIYTFTRDNTSAESPQLTVNVAASGTATAGTDYAALPATVTFAAGANTATLSVDPTDDASVEPDETLILTVSPGTNYNVGSPSSATGTIDDDDTSSVIVRPNTSVLEDGTGTLTYSFIRDNTSGETPELTVNIGTSGSATSGTDYPALPSTITFAAGSNTASLEVDPTDDSVVEPDESLIVNVLPGAGYTVGNLSSATGTILNDDVSTVSIIAQPPSVDEDGTGSLTYTFTRDNTSSETPSLAVNIDTSGTATAGSDYPVPAATVTFAAGASTATLVIDPTDDSIVEPDETLTVNLLAGSDYNVGSPSSASGTITNDDVSAVSVSILPPAPSSVAEDGTGALVYTFARDNVSSESPALTISYSTGGTATAGSDYLGPTGSVTFAAGAGEVTVTVDPTDDSDVEPDESLILTVLSGAGYNLGSSTSATGTILNDDESSVSVAVNPVAIQEDGADLLTYTFTRDNTTSETPALTVNVDLGGTATAGSDYVSPGSSVTFAAGATTATVTIDATDDATVEPDETLTLDVATGPGYNVGSPSSAVGTILNDDQSSVSVDVSQSSVTEDGSGVLTFTFTRDNTSAQSPALSINFDTTGTATAGDDYVASATGTVTFAAGQATATVTADPTPDTVPEPDETVIVTVTTGNGYQIGAPSSATGSILNDDNAELTVTIDADAVSEGDGASATFATVTRNSDTGVPLTVQLSSSDTTEATVPATVTIPAGQASAIFSIDAVDDTIADGTQTATVTASAAAHSSGSDSLLVTDNDQSSLKIDSIESSATMDDKASPKETVKVRGTFSGGGNFVEAEIDWGDGTITQGTVDLTAGTFGGEHQYQTGGIFEVTVTLKDDNGAEVSATTESVVSGVRLKPDGTLEIIGTKRRDYVFVYKRYNYVFVRLKLDGHRWMREKFLKSNVESISVVACDGNDVVSIQRALKHPATVLGGGGNDLILTSHGDAYVDGGRGHDVIKTFGGNDTIVDMHGNNVISTGSGDDTVTTGKGRDYISTSTGNDTITDSGGRNTIFAGSGDDVITTGNSKDTIFADGGNDTISSGGGNDLVKAGSGNDTVDAGSGRDRVYAGSGNDLVRGGTHRDYLYGESGNDILLGETGSDYIVGGSGRDILIGGLGRDVLRGNGSFDILIAGTTDHDDNDESLRAIMEEWSSSDGYLARVQKIRSGGGALDGTKLDATTVQDDGQRDTLWGNNNRDWFFARLGGASRSALDKVRDLRSNEELDEIE